jgi:lysyl-tRNA synthetase class 2
MKDRMNSSSGLRFLRPYLHSDVAAVRKSVYIRFFNTTRCLAKIIHKDPTEREEPPARGQTRSDELKNADALRWPRIRRDKHYMYALEFSQKYVNLKAGSRMRDTYCCIRGMSSWDPGKISADG